MRVLVAFIKEWMSLRLGRRKFYVAKVNHSRRRGELIVMNTESGKNKFPGRSRERIAL
jgi:hypothetical protein